MRIARSFSKTDFSSDAQNIINDVVDAFNDESMPYISLISELNSLKTQNLLLTNGLEKNLATPMIVMGISSANYWNNNINCWIDHFGDNDQIMAWDPERMIALSDAIRGGVAGGFVGGSIGVFAGALVGAGASSCTRGLVYGFTGF